MLLDDLKVLLVLNNSRSLSQAADKLYISRPSLSQRISRLEKKFGAPLVVRTPTGISLTQAGKLTVKFAQNISDMERTLASQIAAIDEHFPANINAGMSFADGVTLLPHLVGQYMREQPDARIHLDAGYEPELVQKLKDGELDFAILENQPLEPGLTIEELGFKKLIFLAPDKPPYSVCSSLVPVESLLKWPMIIYEWNSGRHMVGNRHFRDRYSISLKDHNVVANFDSHEALIGGVKAGVGWAAVPECVYERHQHDSGLIRLKVDTLPLWYPVSLAWSTEHIMSSTAKEFIEFIRDNIPGGYFTKGIEAYINS